MWTGCTRWLSTIARCKYQIEHLAGGQVGGANYCSCGGPLLCSCLLKLGLLWSSIMAGCKYHSQTLAHAKLATIVWK